MKSRTPVGDGPIYTLNPRALCRVVDDEAVALDLDAGQYYGLNAVGTRIWQLLSEGRSVPSICDTLVEEYDVTPDAVRPDVEAFIGELLANGLLVNGGKDGGRS
jgi:hypothetical protein